MRFLFILSCLSILFIAFPAGAKDNDPFTACGVKGSVTLYDQKNDKWFYTDKDDADVRTLPASTFKIVNSLIALDRGVTNTKEIFKWDGVKRSIPDWNQDANLGTAFQKSMVWVYEILAKRLSPEIYNRYLVWIGYGNDDILHGKDGNFWVYGSFGVTPREQIKMLRKLYNNELPFSKVTIDTVKKFMRDKDNKNIFGKTGWTQQNGNHIGWWVGYEMRDGAPIFFATRLTKPESKELGDFQNCRKTITKYYLDRNL